jgi:calcineurin-like phosphoesterase family protein
VSEIIDYTGRKVWIISDCHFFHSKIILYCNRPFLDEEGNPDVEKMNVTMYTNWNNTVNDEDIVFYLGDLCIGKNKREMAIIIDENLSGEKYYLVGNHDHEKMIPNKMIKNRVHYILYKGLKIALSHYPPNTIQWEADILCYGHVHQNSRDVYNSFNCSVENINYTPISLDEIIENLIERNK